MSKTILTGVTPSGSGLHIGNYFGAIKPLVDAGHAGALVYCFVSDLHALTTVQDKKTLSRNIRQVVLDYLACGVEGDNFTFFRQSQVSAHSELAVILNNFVSFGQMKRMHAYKDKLEKGTASQHINMGLFNYPILMAADILLYQPDLVPVGADQKQHVEITRDIAEQVNKKTNKQLFKLPEPLIDPHIGKIVGTDGQRKMSKSLGNIIGIFDDYKIIEKQIMSCFTDPDRHQATDPGRVEGNPVFVFHDLWNDDRQQVEQLKAQYRAGQVGDVQVKQLLLAAHRRYFAPLRERREWLAQHPVAVEQILRSGASQARLVADATLDRVRQALGLTVEFAGERDLIDQPLPLVSFADFARVEWRVGKVLSATNPDWSDKLIEQQVDFGPLGVKTIYSALRAWYGSEDFVGKHLVYVTNIPPRRMGPSVSEGMIVAAHGADGRPERWEVDTSVAAGTVIG